MKIVFFSNFMNHHQEALSNNLYKLTNGGYYFVACSSIDSERLNMGYEDMNKKYDYILRSYESKDKYDKAMELALSCDVMIFGSGDEAFFNARMKTEKLTFRYSERLFKKGIYRRFIPSTRKKIYDGFVKHKKSPLYILCASAYTAYDLKLCGFSKDHFYKWGYFPEDKKYDDIDSLIKKKTKNSIIWVGRLIDWKHPEIPVKIAKRLKDDGIDFKMTIIGSGNMEQYIKNMIKKLMLEEYVTMTGSISPDEVRRKMEESEIFFLTSDFNEGWGAVVNEAMNSACVPVANHAAGSVPYLIEDWKNGLIYKNKDLNVLYHKTVFLMKNNNLRNEFAKNAYKTISDEWNARVAAERVVCFSKELIERDKRLVFNDGPMERARVLKNNWYR